MLVIYIQHYAVRVNRNHAVGSIHDRGKLMLMFLLGVNTPFGGTRNHLNALAVAAV